MTDELKLKMLVTVVDMADTYDEAKQMAQFIINGGDNMLNFPADGIRAKFAINPDGFTAKFLKAKTEREANIKDLFNKDALRFANDLYGVHEPDNDEERKPDEGDGEERLPDGRLAIHCDDLWQFHNYFRQACRKFADLLGYEIVESNPLGDDRTMTRRYSIYHKDKSSDENPIKEFKGKNDRHVMEHLFDWLESEMRRFNPKVTLR